LKNDKSQNIPINRILKIEKLQIVHIFILKYSWFIFKNHIMFIQKIIFMETLIFSNVLYFTSNFRKLLFLLKIRGILFLLQIFLVGETTPGALKTTGGPSKQNYRGTLKKRLNFCPNNLVKGLKISPLTSEKKKSFIYRVTHKQWDFRDDFTNFIPFFNIRGSLQLYTFYIPCLIFSTPTKILIQSPIRTN